MTRAPGYVLVLDADELDAARFERFADLNARLSVFEPGLPAFRAWVRQEAFVAARPQPSHRPAPDGAPLSP